MILFKKSIFGQNPVGAKELNWLEFVKDLFNWIEVMQWIFYIDWKKTHDKQSVLEKVKNWTPPCTATMYRAWRWQGFR
jgi:hypothetical protein